MGVSLYDQAIAFALAQQWLKAIKTNQEILKTNNHDVDSLNRLAYAYLKSGKILTW